MGQYFKYARANGREGFTPCGLKCMEHSYISNNATLLYHLLLLDKGSRIAEIVRSSCSGDPDVAKKLIGAWAGKPVVHAGDYEDAPEGKNNTYDKITDKKSETMYQRFEAALGLAKDESANYWDPYDSESNVKLDALVNTLYLSGIPLYVVNGTKDEYLDLRKLVLIHRRYESKYGTLAFCIDPVSILTVKTDSRGGGDYSGDYEAEAGRWASDYIYITDERPDDMQELKLYFNEFFQGDHNQMDFSPRSLELLLKEVEGSYGQGLSVCSALFNSYAMLGFKSDRKALKERFETLCGTANEKAA